MGEQAGPHAGRSRYQKLIWAALPVAAAATLAAYVLGASDGRVVGPRGDPIAALAKWQAFPVTAEPRPLILTRRTVIDPANGFYLDLDKEAYFAGQFEFATTAPAAPARSGGYTLLSAQAALDRLRSTGSSQPVTRPPRIVEAALTQTAFGTDRGPRSLPAWRFELDGVTDPVFVLAVDDRHLWRPAAPGPRAVDQQAVLSGDGRSVTLSFYAGSPCGGEYTAEAFESRTAVVVMTREVAPKRGQTGRVCPAVVVRRTATVPLAAPLGARVLLTADGSAVPVTGP